MGRRINRANVVGLIIAFCREYKNSWVKRSDVCRICKVSESYAHYAMQMVGDNEPEIEYHKGELRYIGA